MALLDRNGNPVRSGSGAPINTTTSSSSSNKPTTTATTATRRPATPIQSTAVTYPSRPASIISSNSLTNAEEEALYSRFTDPLTYSGTYSARPFDNPVSRSTVEGSNAYYPTGYESVGQAQIMPTDLRSSIGMLNTLNGSIVPTVTAMGKALLGQSKYGMNEEAAQEYARLVNDPKYKDMTEAELVQEARRPQMENQLPYAFIGTPTTDAQRQAVARGEVSPTGQIMSNNYNGPTVTNTANTANAAMPNNATGSQDAGIFKPVTFRSGTGTATLTPEGMTTSLAEPYAGISDMVGEGQGLLGQAAGLAQEEPNRFDYAFDPEASAERLFGQRSDLLQPSFTQRDIALREDQFGQGRLGLLRSADAVGAGTVGGMVNPEQYAESLAQNRALAELAATSQSDAFNQEMQQAGLSQNIYQLNQAAEQQQLANLQGLGQGMFTSGLQAPALEAQLTGIPLQTEALRQNYELGLDSADIQRRLAESQISAANYQPSGWLTGLTSLGSAFLGTESGGNWLSKLKLFGS